MKKIVVIVTALLIAGSGSGQEGKRDKEPYGSC